MDAAVAVARETGAENSNTKTVSDPYVDGAELAAAW